MKNIFYILLKIESTRDYSHTNHETVNEMEYNKF